MIRWAGWVAIQRRTRHMFGGRRQEVNNLITLISPLPWSKAPGWRAGVCPRALRHALAARRSSSSGTHLVVLIQLQKNDISSSEHIGGNFVKHGVNLNVLVSVNSGVRVA